MSDGGQCYRMLNALCPMHIVVGRDGKIAHAGPTAEKVVPDGIIGHDFHDLFEVKRPRGLSNIASLWERKDGQLSLQFRTPPHRQLKAVLTEGINADQMVINLSFGISIIDAVWEYDLTAADFASTDLTVEMLYLVEAKSAAMEASRELNDRLQAARDAAETQALTDMLTGLRNRRAMDQRLAALIDTGQSFALMQIDLDYFKKVNDTLGHAAGDLVLQNVGEAMAAQTRAEDLVARVGGDEFVILLESRANRGAIASIAQRIIEGVQKPIEFEGHTCAVSGSIGIVLSSDYEIPCADKMLGDADVALYAAKHQGRGQYVFFGAGNGSDDEWQSLTRQV